MTNTQKQASFELLLKCQAFCMASGQFLLTVCKSTDVAMVELVNHYSLILSFWTSPINTITLKTSFQLLSHLTTFSTIYSNLSNKWLTCWCVVYIPPSRFWYQEHDLSHTRCLIKIIQTQNYLSHSHSNCTTRLWTIITSSEISNSASAISSLPKIAFDLFCFHTRKQLS